MVETEVTTEDQVNSHIHVDILEVEARAVPWFVTRVESE